MRKVILYSLLFYDQNHNSPFLILEAFVAFLSQRRRPLCQHWASLVLTTHYTVHIFPVIYQKNILNLASLKSYQHQHAGVGLV